MKLKQIFLITTLLCLLGHLNAQNPSSTVIIYDSTDAIFPNPERGFSAYRSSAITQSFITSLRNQAVTVIQRIYTIPQFVRDSLSQSFLDLVDSDLTQARTGGAKVVLRFSYTNNQNGEDAALDTILLHINQLAPILQANYDVIAYIEAGFIGAWGEWYYSTHNLNNTVSRRTVLFALLSVLPVDRAVVVRTPSYKRNIFNYWDPLTPDSAFSGSFRARTGAHNDCFLASATDYGTYGNIEQDKTYLNLDNRYVPQGGETCNPSAYSGCANALVDLARMRWSVLNKDYHSTVLNGWVTNGCMDEIKRRLGYRFRLLNATLQDSAKPTGSLSINFEIVNDGFASPYNPRNLEVMLRNNQTSNKYFLISEEDPRFWMAGDTMNISIEGGIPSDMPQGTYQVLLNFSDPKPALHRKPEYSIRLANENVWEDSTGYNSLLHNVEINANASGDIYNGSNYFQPISVLNIDNNRNTKPDEYLLSSNYPNPFNGSTVIEYTLDKTSNVKIDIYNTTGKIVTTLLQNNSKAGLNKAIWKPENISSGLYFYKILVNGQNNTGKMVYLK